MLIFPIQELLDEDLAYHFLLQRLWPQGLRCPNGHTLAPGRKPHTRDRAPVVDYRCRECGRVFNLFTGTELEGIRYSCVQIVLLLRGFMQGTPTLHLAQELDLDRGNVLEWRHHFQGLLRERFPPEALEDFLIEVDEMYQNAGEKGKPHRDPEVPRGQ